MSFPCLLVGQIGNLQHCSRGVDSTCALAKMVLQMLHKPCCLIAYTVGTSCSHLLHSLAQSRGHTLTIYIYTTIAASFNMATRNVLTLSSTDNDKKQSGNSQMPRRAARAKTVYLHVAGSALWKCCDIQLEKHTETCHHHAAHI